jgi:hypothetical protein
MTGLSRRRKIGWLVVLLACTGLYAALHFRVNAVKSEVRLAERQVVQLEEERLLLETEFLTRSSQQQLDDWNEIEFGYKAPRPGQYLENERQLAAYGVPRGVDAPQPVRVARSDVPETGSEFETMVSPLTGRPIDAAMFGPGRPTLRTVARAEAGPARIPLSAVIDGSEQ